MLGKSLSRAIFTAYFLSLFLPEDLRIMASWFCRRPLHCFHFLEAAACRLMLLMQSANNACCSWWHECVVAAQREMDQRERPQKGALTAREQKRGSRPVQTCTSSYVENFLSFSGDGIWTVTHTTEFVHARSSSHKIIRGTTFFVAAMFEILRRLPSFPAIDPPQQRVYTRDPPLLVCSCCKIMVLWIRFGLWNRWGISTRIQC
jgi:hypothetical protein